MTTLTTEQVEEILALAGAATPIEPHDLMAYEHGGGRLAIIRDGKRDLIADFYGDGADRDYYAALRPQTVSSLATELLALRKRVGELTGSLVDLQMAAGTALNELPADQQDGIVGEFLASIHRHCASAVSLGHGGDFEDVGDGTHPNQMGPWS